MSPDRLTKVPKNSGDHHVNHSYQPAVQHYHQPTFDRYHSQPYYHGRSIAYQAPAQPADGNHNRYEKESSLASAETFFAKLQDIKSLVGKINENVTEIESLRTSVLLCINGDKPGQFTVTLEELVCQTSNLNKEAKEHIRALELNNAKLSVSPSDAQMRKSQLQALKQKFIETIQRYQNIERTFEKKQKQRIERQMLIVQPDATPQEIEDAIDSDDAPQIFAHSLLSSSRLGNATQVLEEVQTRHRDIKKIEKTILELHQLFLDMQLMVEMQQETVTCIEKTTENAVDDLEKGNKHVAVAVNSAKTTRNRKWRCFIIFLILLAVVGILTWWFAFPKAH